MRRGGTSTCFVYTLIKEEDLVLDRLVIRLGGIGYKNGDNKDGN